MKCKLKIILIEENMTQKELAEQLETTQQQVSNWVNGHTVPKMDTLLKMSKILKRSINDMYTLE